MTADAFLASLTGRRDALEQVEGWLAAEAVDPCHSREDVAKVANYRVQLMRKGRSA